jgi:sulfate adenylyltransferase subunit 1 (EFTu-like GTPase family)
MKSVMAGNHLTSIQTGSLVQVMIVNFSHEKIELPKETELRIAEESSGSIVAEINDEVNINSGHSRRTRCGVNTVDKDANLKQYLQDKIGHLTKKDRSVMEPVL